MFSASANHLVPIWVHGEQELDMKSKMMLIVLAVSGAMLTLVSPAVAGEPLTECNGNPCGSFTTSGGHVEYRIDSEPTITCTANSGSGKYTTLTTGEFAWTMKGCKTEFFGFPVSCNSTGQASGVIAMATQVFHNVYVTDSKTTPGLLFTPPPGEISAEVSCSGLSSLTFRGKGLIGDLEGPHCNTETSLWSVNFTATGSSQTFKTVTATGTEYDLQAWTGATAYTMAMVLTSTIKFPVSAKVTCV
jgi:hypothetical protein